MQNFIHFIRELWQQPYFGAILAMLSAGCFYVLQEKNNQHKKIVTVIYYGVFSLAFILFVGKIVERFNTIEIFDFNVFYLYSKVAVAGYNFYLPENFNTVFNSITDFPPANYAIFKEEIVNTGFLYPPPTMLLFAPLGYLSYQTAFTVWMIFILLFVPACIYLSYQLFFKADKLNGLVLVCSLFFLLSPVRSTIVFSQTNFILLFLLLLMKQNEDKKWAGILLALAMFTKPYMVVFVVIFIMRKKWATLLYFTGASLLITFITFLVYGKDVFFSYILNNPAKRLPAWVFDESINQSLHAVLLRAHLIAVDKPLVYYCIAAISVLFTGIYLRYLQNKKLYNLVWVALLLSGLFLYPGTLSYYGTLFLFIIYQLFLQQQAIGFSRYINIAIIGVVYLLSTVSVFACICFLLCVVVYKSIKYSL